MFVTLVYIILELLVFFAVTKDKPKVNFPITRQLSSSRGQNLAVFDLGKFLVLANEFSIHVS